MEAEIGISRNLNALQWLILTMYFNTMQIADSLVLVLASFIRPFIFTFSLLHVHGTFFITFLKPLSQLSLGLSFFFPLQCGQFSLSEFLFSISASFCSSIARVPYVYVCIYISSFSFSYAPRIVLLLKRKKCCVGQHFLPFMVMWSPFHLQLLNTSG